MLRVRIDGGALTTEQLRVIAEISTDVRPRHGRHHRPPEHPAALDRGSRTCPRSGDRLRPSGCPRTEACGDVPRVILGSPVAGIADGRAHRPHAGYRARSPAATSATPSSPNLPRKFKTAITGTPEPGRRARGQRRRVRRAWSTPSTAPASTCGSAAGCRRTRGSPSGWAPSCRRRTCPTCGPASSQIFRDYGYRRLRNQARLKFLLADWGPEKFREVLETEYLGYALPDGPPAAARRGVPGDHVGVHEQRDGRYYVGAAPVVGRVTGTMLAAARRHRRARTARGADPADPAPEAPRPRRPAEAVDDVVVRPARARARGRPGPFRRDTIACTGIEYCKLAIVETKATAAQTVDELERRLADLGSTPRSRCTSTAAPTRAPASRSPTSASRARWSPTTTASRSRASRCTWAAGSRHRAQRGRLRPQACAASRSPRTACADYVERVVRRVTWPSARAGRAVRRPGPTGRTRRPCDERARATTSTRPALADGPRARARRTPPSVPPSARARAARGRSARPAGELEAAGRARPRRASRRRPARDIVRLGGREFGDRLAVACSMADAVLPHLVARALPGVDVLFLETGYHFAETIGTRDAVAALACRCTIVDVAAAQTSPSRTPSTASTSTSATPACAAGAQGRAARTSAAGYEAWVTGVRRDEAPTRADTPRRDLGRRRTAGQDQPARRLDASTTCSRTRATTASSSTRCWRDGYPSIGCAPCTRRVAPGEDPRAGRWAGLDKTECGLHHDAPPLTRDHRADAARAAPRRAARPARRAGDRGASTSSARSSPSSSGRCCCSAAARTRS